MYKLLVVDDEDRVRRSLRLNVDWQKYEIEFIGEATTAEEALGLIVRKEPDLIITDIFMAEMDGLELTKRALEIVPHAKVIILTGYDDFNYVQQAMRNKAFDYLVKPVKVESLLEILNKGKKQIREELKQINDQENLLRQLQESVPVLKERYLNYLLTGRISMETIKRDYDYLNIKLDLFYFAIIVIQIDDFWKIIEINNKKNLQLKMIGVKELVVGIIRQDYQGEVIESYPDEFIVIINFGSSSQDAGQIKEIQVLGETLRKAIFKYYGMSVTIGIGRAYDKSAAITDSLQEALEALEYRVFLGKGRVIYIEDVSIANKIATCLYPANLEKEISRGLKIGDLNNVCRYTKDFINYFTSKEDIAPQVLRRSCLQLLYTVINRLPEWGGQPDEIADKAKNTAKQYNKNIGQDIILIEEKIQRNPSFEELKMRQFI